MAADRVIAIALAEVGYKEKATNANLDNPTANAGSGNWTKYARDLAAAGYYNGNKNGYAWCDVFVDWCFYMAAGKDAKEAQRVQCQTGPLGAAVPYSAGYYKAKGRYDQNPKVGDQVFFQQDGALVHTGLVVGVTAVTVTIVEGNSSDMVKKITYSRTSSYIAGYGHPLYDGATAAGTTSSSTGSTPAPFDHTAKVKEFQKWLGVDADGEAGPLTMAAAKDRLLLALLEKYPLKMGATGDAVRLLQGLLYAAGYDPGGIDGEYGSNTAAAVRAFQAAKGLLADGEAGRDTFAALLGIE